jgi:hypothetical protein
MTEEDEEFSRIEREAKQRMEAVRATVSQQEFVCSTGLCHYKAQRTWVGLTDEDKLHIEIMGGKSDVMLAEMVEAKLKEKNHGN